MSKRKSGSVCVNAQTGNWAQVTVFAPKRKETNMTIQTPLSIDSEGLEGFTVGQAKQLKMQASGGTLPYKWTNPQNPLPAETTISADGVISGIPRTAGSFTVSIMVTDSSQPRVSNTRDFDIQVIAAESGKARASHT